MGQISPHVEIHAIPDGVQLTVRHAMIVLPVDMAREVASAIIAAADQHAEMGMAALPLPEAKVRGDPIK